MTPSTGPWRTLRALEPRAVLRRVLSLPPWVHTLGGWSICATVLAVHARREAEAMSAATGYDLGSFVLAGHLARHGALVHLYDHDPARFGRINSPAVTAAINDLGLPFHPTPFVYPPLIALALQPLAALNFDVLQRVWLLVSVALLLSGYALAARMYAPDVPLAWVMAAVAVLLESLSPRGTPSSWVNPHRWCLSW